MSTITVTDDPYHDGRVFAWNDTDGRWVKGPYDFVEAAAREAGHPNPTAYAKEFWDGFEDFFDDD